jgi:DNA-binding transcriptional MerR regulator
MMTKPLVWIGEAAAKVGVSVCTLRKYEQQGVLPPAKRPPHGQRVYTSDDLEMVRRAVIRSPKEA